MADRAKQPPGEALVDLRRRLSLLPPRDSGRTEIIGRAAQAYGLSIWTMYRALRELNRPKSVRRADHGATRVAPQAEMERYAEIVAALKIRTANRKGRHLSTARAIELLETDGVETPDGLVRARPGLLKRATIDRLLRTSGLDHARVARPTAAVRFQARRSNELWHFDMSPSDLKQVEAPLWIEQGRGKPTLTLFSVVDDRSGVTYEEYRSVYGEDAESALRFLFNAFAAKPEPELPFQGIPTTIYMDNGPVSRSRVFQSVMGSLGIRVLTHMPPSRAERRTPARAKGKSLPSGLTRGSSARSAPSRRCTRRSITSTSRRTRKRRTCGSGALWSPTTMATTAPRRTPVSRTGCDTCLRKVSAPCAHGSGSAPSRASPSGAPSPATRRSPSRAPPTKSSPSSLAKQ
jgi:hypothetical protein